MEELLSAVTKALAESPDIAVWVLAIIYLYKTIIVGSIYGVIRYTVDRAHSAWKHERVVRSQVDYTAKLGKLLMTEGVVEFEALLIELIASRNKRSPGWNWNHVFADDVQYLRKLLAEDSARDK